MPDNAMHDATAGRSIVVWDDECDACNRMKRIVENRVRAKQYTFCPLRVWLETHPDASTAGMHLITPDGRALFGIDAALHVAGLVWWLRPLKWASRLPLMYGVFGAAYRWFANNRYRFGCSNDDGRTSCRLNTQQPRKAN